MAVMMVYHGGYMPVAAANSVVSRQQSGMVNICLISRLWQFRKCLIFIIN